ncbi:MAG: hypothetical protein ACE5GL_05110 [Calditrichia bacterium]
MKIFSNKDTTKEAKKRVFRIKDGPDIHFNSHNLVPVIIQHAETHEVIRLGYLDHWAIEMSLNDKKVYLYRRSRQRVERLGEESEIEYRIIEIRLSHSRRNLLFKVIPTDSEKIETDFDIHLYPDNEGEPKV